MPLRYIAMESGRPLDPPHLCKACADASENYAMKPVESAMPCVACGEVA